MAQPDTYIDHPEFSRVLLALAFGLILCLPLAWLFNEARLARGVAALESSQRIENWGGSQVIDGPWLEQTSLTLFKTHTGNHLPIKQVDYLAPQDVTIEIAAQTTPASSAPILYEADVTIHGLIAQQLSAQWLVINLDHADSTLGALMARIDNRVVANEDLIVTSSAIRLNLRQRSGAFSIEFSFKGYEQLLIKPPASTSQIAVSAEGAGVKVLSTLPPELKRLSQNSAALRWSPSHPVRSYTGNRADSSLLSSPRAAANSLHSGGADSKFTSSNGRSDNVSSYGVLFVSAGQMIDLEYLYLSGPFAIGLILLLLLYGEKTGASSLTPLQIFLAASTPLLFFAALLSPAAAANLTYFYSGAAVITSLLTAGYTAHILGKRNWGIAVGCMLLLIYGLLWAGTHFELSSLAATCLALVMLVMLMYANRRRTINTSLAIPGQSQI